MLAHQESDFKAHGGIRERMARARHEARSDGLEAAIYSRLQEAESSVELNQLVTEICRCVHRTGEKIAQKRGYANLRSA